MNKSIKILKKCYWVYTDKLSIEQDIVESYDESKHLMIKSLNPGEVIKFKLLSNHYDTFKQALNKNWCVDF